MSLESLVKQSLQAERLVLDDQKFICVPKDDVLVDVAIHKQTM